tara:strand:+ start:970 stop:1200 length:231 start_codon:yes stop_codon:yes gene_type:complete
MYYQLNYYYNNKNKILENQKKYYLKNIDKIKKYQSNYYQTHKNRINHNHKERENNKKKSNMIPMNIRHINIKVDFY